MKPIVWAGSGGSWTIPKLCCYRSSLLGELPSSTEHFSPSLCPSAPKFIYLFYYMSLTMCLFPPIVSLSFSLFLSRSLQISLTPDTALPRGCIISRVHKHSGRTVLLRSPSVIFTFQLKKGQNSVLEFLLFLITILKSHHSLQWNKHFYRQNNFGFTTSNRQDNICWIISYVNRLYVIKHESCLMFVSFNSVAVL